MGTTNLETAVVTGQESGGCNEKEGSGSLVPLEEIKEVLELTPQSKERMQMEVDTTRGSSSKGTAKKINPSVYSLGNLGKNLLEDLNAARGLERGFPILKGNLKSPKIHGKSASDLEIGTSKGRTTRNREFSTFSKYMAMCREADGEVGLKEVTSEDIIDLTKETNNDVLRISLRKKPGYLISSLP